MTAVEELKIDERYTILQSIRCRSIAICDNGRIVFRCHGSEVKDEEGLREIFEFYKSEHPEVE